MSRKSSMFLVLAGIFNVAIWPRFAVAIAKDDRAWDGEAWSSDPTTFLWVHALLITTAILVGFGMLLIGVRGLRRR